MGVELKADKLWAGTGTLHVPMVTITSPLPQNWHVTIECEIAFTHERP